MSGRMSLISRPIPGLAVAAVLAVSAALAANAPPVSAPGRDPVEVAPLPPVGDTAAPVAPAPATAAPAATAPTAAATEPEKVLWQQPTFWALIALIETLGAFIATVLYMRKPEQNRLILALAMTGGSAVFITVALIAWLF
jgi:hypothetical protein